MGNWDRQRWFNVFADVRCRFCLHRNISASQYIFNIVKIFIYIQCSKFASMGNWERFFIAFANVRCRYCLHRNILTSRCIFINIFKYIYIYSNLPQWVIGNARDGSLHWDALQTFFAPEYIGSQWIAMVLLLRLTFQYGEELHKRVHLHLVCNISWTSLKRIVYTRRIQSATSWTRL